MVLSQEITAIPLLGGRRHILNYKLPNFMNAPGITSEVEIDSGILSISGGLDKKICKKFN